MFKNPDFTKIAFQEASRAESRAAWEQRVLKETGMSVSELCTRTMEQIDINPLYTAADYEGMNHLNYTAGLPPFLRGPYPTMYVTRPWTVRQYAGFSTAEESNAFYRRNLAAGQRRAWPSTRSLTWRSSSPASRWARCPFP